MLTRDQVLRAVHHCQQHTPDGTARTSDLAHRLGVKGPSVTARVQELATARLVRYSPRRGATLTEEGERQAREAFGKLRQIERFLDSRCAHHLAGEYHAVRDRRRCNADVVEPP